MERRGGNGDGKKEEKMEEVGDKKGLYIRANSPRRVLLALPYNF